MLEISVIIASSTAKRPAVSIITTFLLEALACLIAFNDISTGFLFPSSAYTSTFICSPTTCNWLIAAGLYTSQPTKRTSLDFLVFKKLANFPEKVVLPDPCKPDIRITVGLPAKLTPTTSPPIKSVNSSLTNFIINCPGFRVVNTF